MTAPALLVAEGPENAWAVHDCGYVPLLTNGRLIKKYDPAHQMAEKRNRDYFCLTERVRFRAHAAPDHKRWPGYELGFFHSNLSLREYPGYPDCHIWGDHGSLIRELKRMGEVPKPDQVATLTRMRKGGRDVGVWWPCCWYSGRIDRELAAIAGRPLLGKHGHRDLPPQLGEPGYVRYDPGTTPAEPERPRLELVHDVERPDHSSVGMAPAVLELLDGDQCATGYVLAGGLISPAAAADVSTVRVWLRDHGVSPLATPFPLRLVVAGDRVYVHVSAPSQGGRRPQAWVPVDPGATFPEDVVRRLAAATVSAENVDRTKHLIENHPATLQGANRR